MRFRGRRGDAETGSELEDAVGETREVVIPAGGERGGGPEPATPESEEAYRRFSDDRDGDPPAPVDAATAAVVVAPEEAEAAVAEQTEAAVEIPPTVAAEPDEHAPGGLSVPDGYSTLEGGPNGRGRAVGVVVSRFNGEVTGALLDRALETLEGCGVSRDAVTVMPVPGAFELPLAAMALAKTRRYACVVALGCVIRGETPHFDVVAGEAASGLQLAALETGVPIGFGVLTVETEEQARARLDKGAEAARTALEMADAFARLRAAAAQAAR